MARTPKTCHQTLTLFQERYEVDPERVHPDRGSPAPLYT